MASWEGKTRGGVLGYKIFFWTLRRFGLTFAYVLLIFVVIYFFFSSPGAFSSTYSFYRIRMGFTAIRSIASIFVNYYMFGQILLDKIAMLGGLQNRFTFDFEGEEHLRQIDGGGLLVSGHIGNWEIAGQLLNRLQKKIHIILFDAEHRQIKGYMSEILTRRNVHFIILREDMGHLQEIRSAFENGDIIAMHGDRFVAGNRTVRVTFMGEEAEFPVGPVNMASRFGVPVSFVFAVKERRTHYHFYATPLKHIPFTGNLVKREAVLKEAVKGFAAEMERIVRKYPYQWFNYYPFWKPGLVPAKPAGS